MTNFEKYKDDLMEIEGNFAFNKNTEKIVRCDTRILCKDCLFNELSTCCYDIEKVKWLYKEYEEPILSDDELELIEAIGKATNKKI